MIEKASRKITESSLPDMLNHNRDLLLALSRASQSIQRAHTTVDFYRAMGNEIKPLGGEVTLLMVNEDRQSLSIAYTSYAPTLTRKAEKLTGLSLLEYRIPFSQDSIYGRVMDGGKTVFSDSTSEAITEILPAALRSFTPLLVKIFKLQQGILAPLQAEDGTLGVLKVNGLFLNEDDVPAVESFAGQVATGIQNMRLMQKLQDELTARRQAEESLNHNRNLLLALSRASLTIQQARTPDDIYRAVGDQIKSLGGEVTLLMMNDDRQSLTAVYTSYSPKLLWQIENLTGSSVLGYRIVFSPDSIYARNIASGKTEYVHWARQHVFDGLPAVLRPLTDQFIKLLKIEQGILAPLQVEGEVLGLMMVSGLSLNEGDVPAMESFAGQIAAGVLNARLTQQMQDELSARKQAEDAVRQAENRFKALIEKASDGIVLVGLDGKIQYASPSARSMFDYDNEADIIDDPLTFIHPDDLASVLVAMNDLIHNPAYVPTLEYRYMHKDGAYHWVESTFSNLLAEPGVQAVVINFRDITERKRIEQALHESEKYYRALIENATDGILVLDMDGKIRSESPSVTRMLGYAPESLIGTSAFDLIDPDDLVQIAGAFMEGLNTPGFIHRGEYRLLHHSGEWRCFEIISHYLMEDPAIAGIIINGRDITERKLIEEALFNSESKFHSVVSESSDGIVLSDELGRIIEFNNAIEQITGRKREAVLGQFLWDLQFQIMPDGLRIDENYAQTKEAISKALETGQSSFLHKTLEVPFEHPDGSTRFAQQRGFSARTEKGWRLGSILRDITDNKKVDEALRASEDRYRVLYEDNPSMYFTADANGMVLSVNKFGIGQLGYPSEELVGQSLFNIFHPDDRSAVEVQFNACLQNLKQTVQFEARKIRKDGSMLWVRESACAVYDGRDQIAILLTCDDITKRKQAEEDLQISEEKSKSLYQMLRLMTDNLPDLVWAKDMDGCYTFTNKAMAEKLLIAQDTDEPIGKDDLFFAERQRALHPEIPDWHTFGEICMDSEISIHTNRRPERFEEFGNVKSEFLFLDVYKAPFWDAQGNMIGTVGVGRDVTHEKRLDKERQQVQDALAASEAELRALFASMQDAVLVIDHEGVYCKVAPTNPGRYYITPEELVGRNLVDLFPAHQAEGFIDVIQRVLETRQTRHIEYELTVNGQSPWFEAFVSPMGPDRTLWVARDISGRKQVEAKLYLQSAALEAAANAIVITDRKGVIQWTNSSFTDLTGFGPEEAIGKNPGELIRSGRQGRQFYKDLWDTILSGDIWHSELINRRKDGSLYFEEMTITPLRDPNGEISHFIAVKQDISERKDAEEALIKSEQAYRELFENMPIGLYRTTVDGKILKANAALVDMFGYPNLQDLLARNAKDFYADLHANKKFNKKILENGALSAFVAEFRRYDQSPFWAEDYVHIIYDDSGSPLYYEGSLINITDRKQAEEQLLQTNKSLELAHDELKQMFAHEQVLSRTDGLTGLCNRRYFFEIATREFNATLRYDRPLTVILFDVDGFKQANDAFGHSMGDLILAKIAQVSASQVRDVDVLARYGGDEFIVMLPETSAQQAFMIAERVRESAASTRIETENSPFVLTLSIGVAETIHSPQDESIEDAIRRADKALYMAKQKGRNNTVIFSED